MGILRGTLRRLSAACLLGVAGIGTFEAVRFVRENIPVPVSEGVERAYRGTYAEQSAYHRLLSEMPALRAEALAAMQRRLGLPEREEERVVVRFADSGVEPGTGARTMTRYLNGKRSQVMTFLVAPLLDGHTDFERTLQHEMVHAIVRQRMGARYARVPPWVREGIAVWAAGQLDEKVAQAIAAKIAAGQDPASLLNGLERLPHTLEDYVEDALLFHYLEETYGTSQVVHVIHGILEGERVQDVLPRTTDLGWSEFQSRLRDFSLKHLAGRMPSVEGGT